MSNHTSVMVMKLAGASWRYQLPEKESLAIVDFTIVDFLGVTTPED